jgi:hypothetical protein
MAGSAKPPLIGEMSPVLISTHGRIWLVVKETKPFKSNDPKHNPAAATTPMTPRVGQMRNNPSAGATWIEEGAFNLQSMPNARKAWPCCSGAATWQPAAGVPFRLSTQQVRTVWHCRIPATESASVVITVSVSGESVSTADPQGPATLAPRVFSSRLILIANQQRAKDQMQAGRLWAC